MKRFLLIFIVGAILIGCTNKSASSPVEDAIEEEEGDWYDELPERDEHELIIEAMEENKKLLKADFQEGPYEFLELQYSYNLNDTIHYSVLAYIFDDQHSTKKDAVAEDTMVTYSINSPDGSDIEPLQEDLIEPKELEHDQLTAKYGESKNSGFELIGEYEDNRYFLYAYTDRDDEETIRTLSNSLTTTENGGNDIVFDRFYLDFDQVKFPFSAKEIKPSGVFFEWYDESSAPRSTVSMSYAFMNGNYMTYQVQDQPFELAETEEENTTPDGHSIERETRDGQIPIYRWTDGVYYYQIKLFGDEEHLAQEAVFEIIDTAMNEDRSFPDKELFN